MYERIRALREDRDLKQKDIAAMLGMSQTGYSKYETGQVSMKLVRLSYVSYG